MIDPTRLEDYKMLTNSRKIVKQLNKLNIFMNIDHDLTLLYLNYLKKNYSISEIKMMKQTLENDVSGKVATQSMFIGLFSVLVVLITTIITYITSSVVDETKKIEMGILVTCTLFFYIMIIIFYFFWNQIIREQSIKLINHFNLLLTSEELAINNVNNC